MNERKKQLFIPVPDGRVPVEKDVYEAWWKAEEKENYLQRKLKEERFIYDPEKQIAVLYPSREDSLDRLMEEGAEFAQEQPSVESQAVNAVLVESLMKQLDRQEQEILYQRFVLDRTEEEISASMNLTRASLRRKRDALFVKCRKILNDMS